MRSIEIERNEDSWLWLISRKELSTFPLNLLPKGSPTGCVALKFCLFNGGRFYWYLYLSYLFINNVVITQIK